MKYPEFSQCYSASYKYTCRYIYIQLSVNKRNNTWIQQAFCHYICNIYWLFFLYLLHKTANDFLTVSFKASIEVKRERHLPDKNTLCWVWSSKILPASQAAHVQITDLKKLQKEERLKLRCPNRSASLQQTRSCGSRELGTEPTPTGTEPPGSDSQGWGRRMRRSCAKSLLHQARCLELEELSSTLSSTQKHSSPYLTLQEVSMAIGSLAQEHFSAPPSELRRKYFWSK